MMTDRNRSIKAIPRRGFLQGLLGLGALVGLSGLGIRSLQAESVVKSPFPVQKSVQEWKQQLTPEQYAVLREHDTERPNTSPLLHEKRAGIFHCAGCDNELYDNATKFDSGTGWPSFYQALEGAVGTQEDRSWFMSRVEVHCADCGGHLGHIFDDGPAPTGKRHCINGVAMTFKPKAA
ncbi:MAG: peptide-methionine (R)-S-oxide reductase MsrB [Thiofilum sp.]|uniref:peptide-methionine (R)-S-oxide reductase MsrB n=1 Tax=Thiofilum sp. TaxID=2212733 RepID=UPI0025F2588C|nr:peptide-methionine (R)-S-oxide reductase MsrB [Thiofilum sp.]